jgi:hypothetical protein
MRVLLALVLCAAFAVPASAVCVGDCGGDDEVAVNELVIGVGLALGGGSIAACPSLDMNGDGEVAIGELVTAVNNLLTGCQHEPTPTGSRPATATRTARPSPTITPTPAVGPEILFFGVTSADDTYQPPTGTDPQGIPIYERPFGFGFSLVVETRHGTSNRPVGQRAFTDGAAPDLQVQATQALGNGSTAVCDGEAPTFGGVPAINPPQLDDPDANINALNDLGCRFIDGTGAPEARTCQLGCVHFETGEYGCQAGDATEFQFCAPVPMALRFPVGETLVSARVRDVAGNLGAPAQVIVRVLP